MVFYLDTSALLERYRTEKGTDVVDELYASGDILVTSHFGCLELEAVAARALKGHRVDKLAYDTILGAFARDLDEYVITLPVSSALLNEAADLVRRYSVRAPDAIHLASAHRARKMTDEETFRFVASDRELLTAG